MATSAMTDHQTTTQSLQDHDHHHPIRRSSGRRKAKGGGGDSKKNKQPRRGMGMAKLEQLRLQETTTQPPSSPPFGPTRNPPPAFPGLHASDYRLLHHHVLANHDSDFLANSAVKCYSLHCNACHKKKRVNGEDLGSNDRKFLGLNIGDNQNVVLNEDNLGEKAVGNHANKAAEVVAIHRKGSSSIWDGGNGRVMMEYDFFPKVKSDAISEAVRSLGSSSMAGFDVDLSLKLSY